MTEAQGYRLICLGVKRKLCNETCWEKSKFETNVVTTAMYNVYTFIPKVLKMQLLRVANLYFLFIAVLQTIDSISNTHGVPTILFPLSIVILCSAVKEALEDIVRHRSDESANSKLCQVLSAEGIWKTCLWREVMVGDVVRVKNNEAFPADMILIASEGASHNHQILTNSDEFETCYIETKSLDGETNLKLRRAIPEICSIARDNLDLNGHIECEQPNSRIASFEGNISIILKSSRLEELRKQNTWKTCNIEINPEDNSTLEGLIQVKSAITPKQLLLRSCYLRNTKAIIGIVVFTGHETKVFRSSTKEVMKTSGIEKKMNKFIVGIFLLQQVLCFIAACIGTYWDTELSHSSLWYLNPIKKEKLTMKEILLELIQLHFTFFVIMQNFVPISLNVSVEFVKYWQAYFIQQDIEMYDSSQDMPSLVRSSALNEDLGRVRHLFTDKTGTLTRNMMQFRYCSINGVHYGKDEAFPSHSNRPISSASISSTSSSSTSSSTSSTCGAIETEENSSPNSFNSTCFLYDQRNVGNKQSEAINHFLIHIALCHNVLPELPMDEMIKNEPPKYSASSPDEHALIVALYPLGIRFLHRTTDQIFLLREEKVETYDLLQVFEFDSDRKRMSVIVRYPDKSIRLLCKGADNVIYQLLSLNNSDLSINKSTCNHLSNYAQEGLRTLCFAWRSIENDYYLKWEKQYLSALKDLNEVRKKRLGEFNRIDVLVEEIEKDLILIGATGIEDRLQNGVKQTLQRLHSAHIKIWTLTGDKVETAINIGYATSLLHPHMILLQLERLDHNSTLIKLQSLLLDYSSEDELNPLSSSSSSSCTWSSLKQWFQVISCCCSKRKQRKEKLTSLPSFTSFRKQTSTLKARLAMMRRTCSLDRREMNTSSAQQLALIIDGATLEHALKPQLSLHLYKLSTICTTIICCRVSPKQKAQMVELIRHYEGDNSITLAIGDGANDVAMIQSAHIGVGLNGQEGTQAVNASDYAIAQFCFLERLLLVHGRWAYRRVAKLMSYMLYKNVAYVATAFWFGWYSGFSGQSLIVDMAAQSFNVLYTSIPILLFAITEQDVSATAALSFPALYSLGQENSLLKKKVFWPWIINGVWHSLVLFFISTLAYEGGILGENPLSVDQKGQSCGLYSLGMVVFTNLILLVNCKLALETYLWTWRNVVILVFSILLWYIFALFISSFPSSIPSTFQVMHRLLQVPDFWFTSVIVVAIALVRDWLWKALRRECFPKLYHLIQERELKSSHDILNGISTSISVRSPSNTTLTATSATTTTSSTSSSCSFSSCSFSSCSSASCPASSCSSLIPLIMKVESDTNDPRNIRIRTASANVYSGNHRLLNNQNGENTGLAREQRYSFSHLDSLSIPSSIYLSADRQKRA